MLTDVILRYLDYVMRCTTVRRVEVYGMPQYMHAVAAIFVVHIDVKIAFAL